METIAELMSRHHGVGLLEWIGIRPARRREMISCSEVSALETGLQGDHYNTGGKRSVTLLQFEHLSVIGAFMGSDPAKPELLRRNLIVSGINLIGIKNRRFSIGDAVLEGTGICAPCSRMEENLGSGGYSAVRGHGGITARITNPAIIRVGDKLSPL